MQIAISAAVVLLIFVGLPLWMILSLRKESMGEVMFGEKNHRKSRSGIGNALQELDRIMARPSIEYRVQAEDQDRLVEDEKGSE